MISKNEDIPVIVYAPGITERHPKHDASSMSVMEATYEPGVTLSRHAHDEDEITYIIKGKIRLVQEGEEVTLGAGSYFYTPAGVVHHIVEVIEPTTKLVVGVKTHSEAHNHEHHLGHSHPHPHK